MGVDAHRVVQTIWSKTKDAATDLDLVSFFASRAGVVLPYFGIAVWSMWISQRVLRGEGPDWVVAGALAVVWIAVPLGLRLADQVEAGPATSAIGLLRALVLPAAVITSLAFGGDPGFSSAVLTVPWLMFCGWAACVGIIRFLSRSGMTMDSILRDISLLALAAGAFCLTISQVGLTPLGLTERRMTFLASCGMGLVWLLPLLASRFFETALDSHRVVVQLTRPTAKDLRSLRARVVGMAPTVESGLVNRDLPPGYRWDEWTLPIPNFENSCEALWEWAGHAEAGVLLEPPRPSIRAGETFVFGIPFGPLSVTGACQITGIINEADVYGFVFAPLSHNAWSGEQSLMLTNIDGEPAVTATAIWSPTVVGSKLIPPLTRHLLGRHINSILEALAEAEVAELHSRMQDVVSRVVAPRAYRPAVDLPVPEADVMTDIDVPATGSDLLAQFESNFSDFESVPQGSY